MAGTGKSRRHGRERVRLQKDRAASAGERDEEDVVADGFPSRNLGLRKDRE